MPVIEKDYHVSAARSFSLRLTYEDPAVLEWLLAQRRP
jgi:hypothetical protein